jgi:L-2,4-diaminobutyrate transaminase
LPPGVAADGALAHYLERLERVLAEQHGRIAAMIIEPLVQAAAGMIVHPPGYLRGVRELTRRYDVLLIADEVVTGFGRLGTMFGSDHYGMESDIITIAKGLTSAYAPLSGSIISDKVWKVLERGTDELGPIGHGWTYSAHPIGAAAGVANLKLIDELGLVENARDTGAYFVSTMREALARQPIVGEVRGEGMLCAVELVEDKESRRFFDPAKKVGPQAVAALLKRGVIARAMPQGDIIGYAPPLCLTRAEADTVVMATREAIEEVAANLRR